jgi:hypothetical protein
MRAVELSEDERAELRSLLTAHLADLRLEVAGTNSLEFREALQRRELLLQTLLHRLE